MNGAPVTNGTRKWPTLERVLLLATFVTSILAFTFGIGVQWARTSQNEARIEAVRIEVGNVKADYVRQDVYASDQRRLSESIDRLTSAVNAGVYVRSRAGGPSEPSVEPVPFRPGVR